MAKSNFLIQQRSQRVREITLFVGLAIGSVLPLYWATGELGTIVPLAVGLAMMFVCQLLDRKGRTEAASVLLVVSITVMSCALQWMDQGLRDASVLTFPVVLILAGLLVGTQSFILLLLTMVSFLGFMTYATEVIELRHNRPNYLPFDHWRDATLILLISGWSVWFVMKDLRIALLQAHSENEKYQEAQEHLTHVSLHDVLTGLPNRALQATQTEQFISMARRSNKRLAFMFIDLDNFKDINDSLGHAAGDQYLKQVASELRRSVRDTDLVSRHGGDEFVIAMSDITDLNAVSLAAMKVINCVSQPFALVDTKIVGSCSVGIAIYPDDSPDYDSLLRNSDSAMYAAKTSGKNAFRYFDESMSANANQNLRLVLELRDALVRQEFELHYQPIVELASGKLHGCEALIRWNHPERGLVPPLSFIPAAEKSGLILDIGAWVLEEACMQMSQWQNESNIGSLILSVNISPVQFQRGDLPYVVSSALRKSGLPPSTLELEVTESTLIADEAKFLSALSQLKALGVKVSIDDFGVGCFNLSYLQRIEVNRLKIDQSFVKTMLDGDGEMALVRAIVQMSKSLNLSNIAEGIEDAEIKEALVELGTELGQGYLFSRPLSANLFRQSFLETLPTSIEACAL